MDTQAPRTDAERAALASRIEKADSLLSLAVGHVLKWRSLVEQGATAEAQQVEAAVWESLRRAMADRRALGSVTETWPRDWL